MTGTSKALRRLGVAGLSTVLMTTGLAAFGAVAANAVVAPPPATSVSLSPDSDTAAADTCNAFTATVAPTGSTFQVNITQGVPSGAAAHSVIIGFCNPTNKAEGDATGTRKPSGNIGGNTTVNAGPPATCDNTNAFNASPPAGAPNEVSCTADFTDDGDGTLTFGVISNTAGNMDVTAFSDTGTVNGVRDVGEPGDSSTKTWVANSATNSNTISCTPTSATNDVGDTHTFKCTVKNSGGVALRTRRSAMSLLAVPMLAPATTQ